MRNWFVKMFINKEILLKDNRVLFIILVILAVLMVIVVLRWLIGKIIGFFKNCKEYFRQDAFQRLDKKYTNVRVKTSIVVKRYLIFQFILVLALICFLIGFGDIPYNWEGIPKSYFLIVGIILALIGYIAFCILYVKRAKQVSLLGGYVSTYLEPPGENLVTETTTRYESWDGGASWRETGSETNTYDANVSGEIFASVFNFLVIAYNIVFFFFSVVWYIVLSFFTTLYILVNAPLNTLRRKKAFSLYEKKLKKTAENEEQNHYAFNFYGPTKYSNLLELEIGTKMIGQYWRETKQNVLEGKENFFFVGCFMANPKEENYPYQCFFVKNVQELLQERKEGDTTYYLYKVKDGKLIVAINEKNNTFIFPGGMACAYIPDIPNYYWLTGRPIMGVSSIEKERFTELMKKTELLYVCYLKEKVNDEIQVHFLHFSKGEITPINIQVKNIEIDEKSEDVIFHS